MSNGEPTSLPDGWGRYREILPDWQDFERAVHPPAPCILAHPARTDRAALAALLTGLGVASEPVAWNAGALRLPEGCRPGLLWPLRAGLYQIQEEASMLPVMLLDPRPGERVLDLCAAPGGKTAQIAVALGLRGTVVANDRNERRLSALREKAKRWGLVNVSTTVVDGGAYPLAAGPFDRVLVDAPCSAERRASPPRTTAGESLERFRQRISSAQRALLRRALALCRPGGRVVYSTCSLAPEENEAVVDAVLREKAVSARVLPLRVPALVHSPGLVEWNGTRFEPSLRHALRLWPHRAGTGGFFAAALECKREDGAPAAVAATLEPPDEGQRARVDALARHFGLPPEALSQLRLLRRGRRWLHAVASDHRPPAVPEPLFLGVPLFKLDARHPKPTTAGALLLGRLATRNAIEVDAEQLSATLSRRPFSPRAEQLEGCDGRGFVILRHHGIPLGAGLLARGEAGLVVESQVPRSWVPERELQGDGG
ncbi:MAG: RsmB/NOP family class I SAM-dependent RNA methyltransferase [Myxococcota bacterium]|nr:RsmB/NOP family class I SAM-dependent RNA methyltransferase [Myxococcota bacterium]